MKTLDVAENHVSILRQTLELGIRTAERLADDALLSGDQETAALRDAEADVLKRLAAQLDGSGK